MSVGGGGTLRPLLRMDLRFSGDLHDHVILRRGKGLQSKPVSPVGLLIRPVWNRGKAMPTEPESQVGSICLTPAIEYKGPDSPGASAGWLLPKDGPAIRCEPPVARYSSETPTPQP